MQKSTFVIVLTALLSGTLTPALTAKPEWTIPPGIKTYDATQHKNTNWQSTETPLGKDLKAVVGIVCKPDPQKPWITTDKLYYCIDIEQKIDDNSSRVLTQIDLPLDAFTPADLKKTAQQVTTHKDGVVTFTFEKYSFHIKIEKLEHLTTHPQA